MMRRFSFAMAGCALLLLMGGCASEDSAARAETNSPQQNTSAIPWNRPESWEGSTGYGGMMNQPAR